MLKEILIVEDDLIASFYLKKMLTDNDLSVCALTDNSVDAIKICKEKKPSLILMDIMIKGNMSGCDLAMKIRSFDKDVLIIFLTAYSTSEMIEYALDSKAYSYLLKPYRDIEILSTVKMALKEYKQSHNENHKVIARNGFVFDTQEKKLYQYHKEVFLSDKLKILIEVLFRNKASSVSYEQISFAIWNENKNINTLRAIIFRLKNQLPDLDLNIVNKIGYVLY